MVSKLIGVPALIALVVLLACGGGEPTDAPADATFSQATEAPAATASPSPTPEPTATPKPTATPAPTATAIPEPTATPKLTAIPAPTATAALEPTATPKPTATPASTATAVPEPEVTPEPTAAAQVPGTGAITPLRLNDPLTVASELSESELACLTGVADIGRLMAVFAAPELASPEERTMFIGCLEDESLLRIFLTDMIEGSGPLSVETSACIRTGMEGVDLRAVMASSPEGGEEAAMAGSMSAFILTLMCLNDEEWEGAAAMLGSAPEERENLQCVLEKMGGPEGFAETLGAGDESSFFALFGAATECGVQMGGLPGG